MDAIRYLPSTQFLVIVGSILLSGGLVVAAERFANPPATPTQVVSTTPGKQIGDPNWQATLEAMRGTAPILTPPDQDTINALLSAAESPNLTTTVGRSLLINISAAKSQGLGSDIPTQEQVVAQARAQIASVRSAPQYTNADLTLAAQSDGALKTYGNAVMGVMLAHPRANYEDTIIAVGNTADSGTATHLGLLPGIQQEYRAILSALLATPVPSTLAPLHLKVVNDLSLIVASYDDMVVALEDPLRGLAGLDLYDSTTDELTRVFINIGQILVQNGILFSKDEPGSAWSTLLP